jgi:hypothetical protein
MAKKTKLIYFTRKKHEHLEGLIALNSTAVQLSATAKLLGVVFNWEL